MSKTFNTVNIHKFMHKLTQTNIPNIIIKFIANFIKEQQACTQCNNTLSKLKQINTGVLQDRVLSPTLFNIYTIDITITASHTKHHKAQQLIQPYFHKIYERATTNNLHINTDKNTTTLFTLDPAEYGTTHHLDLIIKLHQ